MAVPWGAKSLQTILREVTKGFILLLFVVETSPTLLGNVFSATKNEFDSLGPGSPSEVVAYGDISFLC